MGKKGGKGLKKGMMKVEVQSEEEVNALESIEGEGGVAVAMGHDEGEGEG